MDFAEPSPTGLLLHAWGSFYQFLAMSSLDYTGWKQETDSCTRWSDSKVELELASAVLVVFCSSAAEKQSCRGLAV